MMPKRLYFAAAIAVAAPLTACRQAPDTDPLMVSEWIHTLYGVVRAERLTPPVAARFLGYAAVALHEGLSAATPGLPSLAGVLNGLGELPRGEANRDYDPTFVALEAERVVLDSMLMEALPSSKATLAGLLDSLGQARVALGVREDVRTHSEELGRRIGTAIIAWSRTDGFDSTRTMQYVPPVGPGLWLNDSPGSVYASQSSSGATEFVALDNPTNALRAGNASDRDLIVNRPKQTGLANLPAVDMTGATEPYWGRVRPFFLTTWDECPIPDPPAYATAHDSPLYEQAREVYDAKMNLTPEQRTIALYWADNPGETATPAGHWMAIGAQMVSSRNLSAGKASLLFVATTSAAADAFIATWGYKYKFNLLRPRSYIRQVIDPAWEPMIPTPPFPAYPSGHSTQSAASAVVVKGLLGDMAFEDSTEVPIGHAVRNFNSFGEAAEEAGWSRIYGGIHFHVDKSAGKAVGECIGAKIMERLPAVRAQ